MKSIHDELEIDLLWNFVFIWRNCIECLGFDSGLLKDNCSKACSNITHNKVDLLGAGGKQCELKDSKGCWMKFSLEQLVGEDNYHAVIQNERGKMGKVTFQMWLQTPNGSVLNWHIQQRNFTVFFHLSFGCL